MKEQVFSAQKISFWPKAQVTHDYFDIDHLQVYAVVQGSQPWRPETWLY